MMWTARPMYSLCVLPTADNPSSKNRSYRRLRVRGSSRHFVTLHYQTCRAMPACAILNRLQPHQAPRVLYVSAWTGRCKILPIRGNLYND
jgi:hypothetical protein